MQQIEFQNCLKAGRKNSSLTQDEVAQKLYVSRQAVSSWENGHTVPDVFTLQSLATLYGLSLDDLLNSQVKQTKNTTGIPFQLFALTILITGRLITLGSSFQLIVVDFLISLGVILSFLLKRVAHKTAFYSICIVSLPYFISALYTPFLNNFGFQVASFFAAVMLLCELFQHGSSNTYRKGPRHEKNLVDN